ncbi:hypothetical protein ACLB2K_038451 [Fragaria x ananassa]
MKKLLKDGRKPEQVNDVLGLRVILEPKSGEDEAKMGERACYRTREVVRSLWKEMPHRTKDYIARPKANGYRSLQMAVDVSDSGKSRPLMEIQIRTQEMDMLADAGTASHSLYKSGLTNPEEAKRLKAIMMAAAELAAFRLKDLPSANHGGIETEQSKSDRVFRLLDKNGDGRINFEELKEVMEELGAPGEDACEMMQLLDANSDGSLSSDEFDLFQKQVEFMRNFVDRDEQYKTELNEKLQIAENNSLIQGFKVCRYLFVRCDNELAPWTWYVIMNSQHLRPNIAVPAQRTFAKSFCSDVHGDHPRPLPAIKELKNATDITERKESPSWDYDEDKECWIWKKPPPPSKIRVKKQACEEKLTRKRKTSNNAENVVDDGALRNKKGKMAAAAAV